MVSNRLCKSHAICLEFVLPVSIKTDRLAEVPSGGLVQPATSLLNLHDRLSMQHQLAFHRALPPWGANLNSKLRALSPQCAVS